MKPPVAKRIPKNVGGHGEKRIDDFHWLRHRDDPAVIDYLKAENEFTASAMKHTEDFQRKLFEELLGRIKETDVSVPEKIGDYYYYSRTEKGKQYAIYCRKRGSIDADEEIVLDENELAVGHSYFHIGVLETSMDHKLLAYSVDTSGSESYTLYIKDLETGKLFEGSVQNTYYGVEWANDNKTLFYNKLDDAMRPHKLYRHEIGTAWENDQLVFHEKDEAFYLGINKSRSKRYIVIDLRSNTTTEVRLIDAENPDLAPRIVHPRQHEMEYHVHHHDQYFYILTNDNAKNFKVMKAPVDDPQKSKWTEVVPHRETVKIDDVDVFENHVIVYERKNALKMIRVLDLASGQDHYVKFPEPVYTFWASANPEFSTNVVRFNYSSLVTPRSVFDYNVDTRGLELKKQYEVLGGYNIDDYHTERIFAGAADGTRIPVTLVHKKGLVKDASNPVYMYGYGAYGASVEPTFAPNRLSLLDRGFVFAIAHVRGGGDMGRLWYEKGKLLYKRNTFTDFIACAEHLIQRKYTAAGKIAVSGGSAGGLLLGAVINMRPGLFRAAVAHVPFVDVITTMMDKTLPLTVIEYEEWGNPEDKKYYEYMRSYSPYDNVKQQDYPHILVTAGLNDPRVQYWEPAKWVAKLRTRKTDDNLLLLRTKLEEGHAGASGRYDYLHDTAVEYAFVFDCFGITQ